MEPLEAAARENYRLWLRYDDGACGEVDLSCLVGQGVFAAWSDPAFYQTARLTPHGSVAWGEDGQIELCADALYLQLTGKSVEDAMPGALRALGRLGDREERAGRGER